MVVRRMLSLVMDLLLMLLVGLTVELGLGLLGGRRFGVRTRVVARVIEALVTVAVVLVENLKVGDRDESAFARDGIGSLKPIFVVLISNNIEEFALGE